MEKLRTDWKLRVDFSHPERTEIPLSEYPRPQMVREEYEILNGIWEYAITEGPEAPETMDGPILVPFSPETDLSGVGRILMPGQYLHYRRTFVLDHVREGRLLLHFGAVDQTCRVLVNGREAGFHEGGYLAFTLDITDLVREGDNLLALVCQDGTDTAWYSRGKQRLERGGMFYTPQSGIWKSVWMEWVPADYIRGLFLEPMLSEGMLELRVLSASGRRTEISAMIRDENLQIRQIHFYANDRVYLHIPDPHPWTPEDPHLYEIIFQMGQDRVTSYFAMRSFEKKKDRKGTLRFFLNGEPCFLNGVLDQGYWPESLMTPPADEALIYDIRTVKELGYNMIRKHVKIESARFYYHCDRLGMLVWQDMVNGGTAYDMNFVTYMPNALVFTQRHTPDDRYKILAREDEEGRRHFEEELDGMLEELGSAPCICTWGPFNEGWGQFDAARISRHVRDMDRTRLIDEASGWFDQKGGDYYSVHNYFRHFHAAPGRRIVALTEYGGYSCLIPGHASLNKVYGYRKYDTEEALADAYEKLIRGEILPNIRFGLSAAVFTQLSDIEDEVNGLLTYDRKVLKIPAGRIRKLNRMIRKEFDKQT